MKLKEFDFNELIRSYSPLIGLSIRMGDGPWYGGFINGVLDDIPIEWAEAEIETTRWFFDDQFVIILKEEKNKMKNPERISSTIQPGSVVKSKEYGTGVCRKIDLKNKYFRYFFRFVGEKKIKGKPDVTLIWLSAEEVDKMTLAVEV